MVHRRMSSYHSMHHVIIIKACIIKSECIADCASQRVHHSMEEYHHKNKLLYTPHSLCLHMLLTHQYTNSLLIPIYIYLYISLYTHINTILFTPLTDKLYIHSILKMHSLVYLLNIHSHLQTHCTYILMSTLTVNHMLLLYIKYIMLFTYIPCLSVHVKLSISLSHSYHICCIIKRCSFLLSTCCSSRSQPT